MSIFGKDHYIKFCITMLSWQKMAESMNIKVNITSSQQVNNENRDILILLLCV